MTIKVVTEDNLNPNHFELDEVNKRLNIKVTKNQVGLGNADNTSDANKPISAATQTALNNKVDKVVGKELSTNDYTTAEKTKLANVPNITISTNEPSGGNDGDIWFMFE